MPIWSKIFENITIYPFFIKKKIAYGAILSPNTTESQHILSSEKNIALHGKNIISETPVLASFLQRKCIF